MNVAPVFECCSYLRYRWLKSREPANVEFSFVLILAWARLGLCTVLRNKYRFCHKTDKLMFVLSAQLYSLYVRVIAPNVGQVYVLQLRMFTKLPGRCTCFALISKHFNLITVCRNFMYIYYKHGIHFHNKNNYLILK